MRPTFPLLGRGRGQGRGKPASSSDYPVQLPARKIRHTRSIAGIQPMTDEKLPPIHPGEILLTEFLEPLGISQYRLATDISVPPRRINEIVKGKRAITANTALRLSRYFATSDRFWLNLQTHFDLEVERDRMGDSLEDEVQAFAHAKL